MMFATANVGMMETVADDPNTTEGWAEANRRARVGNKYEEDRSSLPHAGGLTGYGAIFHTEMRKEGTHGCGTAQKLGKHGDCPISCTLCWDTIRARGIDTMIEQCEMTRQIGAVSSEENVPPDCIKEIYYIDKGGKTPSEWKSFLIWSAELAKEKIVGTATV